VLALVAQSEFQFVFLLCSSLSSRLSKLAMSEFEYYNTEWPEPRYSGG